MVLFHRATDIPLYHRGLTLAVVDTIYKDCPAFLKHKEPYSEEWHWDDYKEAGGLSYHDDPEHPCEYFIFLEKTSLTNGLIAHEIAHSCYSILLDKNVGLDDSVEALTHLIQWMTDWVYAKLKGKFTILRA